MQSAALYDGRLGTRLASRWGRVLVGGAGRSLDCRPSARIACCRRRSTGEPRTKWSDAICSSRLIRGFGSRLRLEARGSDAGSGSGSGADAGDSSAKPGSQPIEWERAFRRRQ